MSEINIRRAIYGKLAGDTTLNGLLATPPAGSTHSIWPYQAPDAALSPYVIFNNQSGVRTYTFANRAFDDELWQIKGIARKGESGTVSIDDAAGNIADRLDALLTDSTLSISGATQRYFRFETPIRYSEDTPGQPRIVHAGALFRLVYI